MMEQKGSQKEELSARVRERIALYLDDEIDVDALEGLIAHIIRGFDLDDESDDEESLEESSIRDLEAVFEAVPEGHGSSYIESIFRALGSPPSDQVLRSSLLVSLVGELEIYVNQLLRACFARVPAAVDDNKASFTWSEVSGYESLEDFRASVTDRVVERAMYGGLEEWLEFLGKKFGIKIPQGSLTPVAAEVFQRRHCIVHYGGTASFSYVEKMKKYDSNVESGDPLDVTPEYLARAADELYMIAMSLNWATVHKLVGNADYREEARDFAINCIYHLLGDQRFTLARTLSEALPTGHLSFDQSLIVNVNRWLAYKLQDRFEEVRAEVEDFRTTSLSRRFSMARHALLDEHEEAYRIADAMLRDSSDDFPLSHYLTWPLLRGVRRWARANVPHDSLPGASVPHADVVASDHSLPRKEES